MSIVSHNIPPASGPNPSRAFDSVRFPDVNSLDQNSLDQDQEWCEVVRGNESIRVRFHDYDQIFSIPGLYEEIFYHRLECQSPTRVIGLLTELMEEFEDRPEPMRVLDVGAGNGMVGEELKRKDAATIVGIDIIEEAKTATERDRPSVYDDYVIGDLTDLPVDDLARLQAQRFNCLTTVAALGYGDIPPEAFTQALDLIETDGWVAFNIKEDFLREHDSSGFQSLIRQLIRDDYLRPYCHRRFQHRLSITGEPLYYVATIAKKVRPLSRGLL